MAFTEILQVYRVFLKYEQCYSLLPSEMLLKALK